MLNKKLKELRKINKITQNELSKKITVSCQTISNWESGISMPDYENLIKLSNLFNVSIEYFLENTKSKSNFNYYTVSKPKKEKLLNKVKTIILILTILEIDLIVTLITITLLKPISFYDGSTGNSYNGFVAYYYTYPEFRLGFISGIMLLIMTLIILFMPNKIIENIFKRKI